MQRGGRRTGTPGLARTTPFPFVIMILLAAAAMTACSSAAPTPTALTVTKQVHLSPVGPDGSPASGFRTTMTIAGANCEAGSEVIGQAYRCFAGNFVYDPCWAERASSPTVLCVPFPWSTTDIRLQVGAPLGAIPPEPGTSEPWGIELANGQRCVLLQGAHSMFAGRVIDYYCTSRLSLLRGLTQTSAVWRAASVTDVGGKEAAGPPQQIKIAWFGRPASYH